MYKSQWVNEKDIVCKMPRESQEEPSLILVKQERSSIECSQMNQGKMPAIKATTSNNTRHMGLGKTAITEAASSTDGQMQQNNVPVNKPLVQKYNQMFPGQIPVTAEASSANNGQKYQMYPWLMPVEHSNVYRIQLHPMFMQVDMSQNQISVPTTDCGQQRHSQIHDIDHDNKQQHHSQIHDLGQDNRQQQHSQIHDIDHNNKQQHHSQIHDVGLDNRQQQHRQIHDIDHDNKQQHHSQIHDLGQDNKQQQHSQIHDVGQDNKQQQHSKIHDIDHDNRQQQHSQIHDVGQDTRQQHHSQIHDIDHDNKQQHHSQIHDICQNNRQQLFGQIHVPLIDNRQQHQSQIQVPVNVNSQQHHSQIQVPVIGNGQQHHSQMQVPVNVNSQQHHSQIQVTVIDNGQQHHSQIQCNGTDNRHVYLNQVIVTQGTSINRQEDREQMPVNGAMSVTDKRLIFLRDSQLSQTTCSNYRDKYQSQIPVSMTPSNSHSRQLGQSQIRAISGKPGTENRQLHPSRTLATGMTVVDNTHTYHGAIPFFQIAPNISTALGHHSQSAVIQQQQQQSRSTSHDLTCPNNDPNNPQAADITSDRHEPGFRFRHNSENNHSDVSENTEASKQYLLTHIKKECKELKGLVSSSMDNVIGDIKMWNKCEICRKEFTSKSNIARHVQSVHYGMRITCKICQATYARPMSLKAHVLSLHVKNNPSNTCGGCGYVITETEVRKESETRRQRNRSSQGDQANGHIASDMPEQSQNLQNPKSNRVTMQAPESNKADLISHIKKNCIRLKGLDPVSNIPQWAENGCTSCRLCLTQFQCTGILKRHVLTVHCQYKVTCQICQREFSRKDNLKKHLLNFHTDNNPTFKCGGCGESPKDDLPPKKPRSSKLSCSCEVCGKTLSSASSLRVHMCIHIGKKKNEKCRECMRYYSGSFEKHVRRVHRASGSHLIKCLVCNKAFSSQYVRDEHMNIHTGNRPFTCVTCGKSFPFSASLYSHRLRHERKVPCKQCGKMIKKGKMSVHLAVHSNLKPHQCDACGKTFRFISNLMTHLKCHSSVRLHSCDVCERKFKLPHQLRAHKKTHRST